LKDNGIGDSDGDAAVDDDGNDALFSDDPRSNPDDVFSKVSSLDLTRCFCVF
jgi:hypothetical protein